MDTVRADVSYRPLRIGWVIRDGDLDGFRNVARLTCTLWGGRFNPLIPVSRPAHAAQLIETFRVDLLLPVGESSEVAEFIEGNKHLASPLFPKGLFSGGAPFDRTATFLDVHNFLAYVHQRGDEEKLNSAGVRSYSWSAADPLADVLLIHAGQYPAFTEIGIDYGALLRDAVTVFDVEIDPGAKLRADLFESPSFRN